MLIRTPRHRPRSSSPVARRSSPVRSCSSLRRASASSRPRESSRSLMTAVPASPSRAASSNAMRSRRSTMPRFPLFALLIALAGCSGLIGLKDVTFNGGDGGTGGSDGQPPDAAPVPNLYWAELSTACDLTTVRRMAVDGTMPANVLTLPPPDQIQDLAIDPIGQKIYYSYSGSSANQTEDVERVNLDGSGREPLKTYGTRPTPVGVAVDPAADTIYWVATRVAHRAHPRLARAARSRRHGVTAAA